MGETKTFPCTLDRLTRIVTPLVCVLLIGVALSFVFIGGNEIPAWAQGLVVAVLVLVLPVSALFMPRRYVLEDVALRIVRFGPDLRLPYARIAAVDGPDIAFLQRGIRLMGSGGFLGYFGLFRSKALGNFWLYATRRDTPVVLRLRSGWPCVVTPDAPEAFVAALRARLGA